MGRTEDMTCIAAVLLFRFMSRYAINNNRVVKLGVLTAKKFWIDDDAYFTTRKIIVICGKYKYSKQREHKPIQRGPIRIHVQFVWPRACAVDVYLRIYRVIHTKTKNKHKAYKETKNQSMTFFLINLTKNVTV